MIAPDYKKQGVTVIPTELRYVEVVAVTADSGSDTNTGEQAEEGEDRELPDTVTLLATPEQSLVLAELEAEGEIHLSLVYRGEQDNAQEFLTAQEKVLEELYKTEDAAGGEEKSTADSPEETGEPEASGNTDPIGESGVESEP